MTVLKHDFHNPERVDWQRGAPPPSDGELYGARLLAAEGQAERKIGIRFAGSDDLRESACELINRRYAWRGYGDNHRLLARPASTTFTASLEDEIVGTITLNVDSPQGLAADQIFRAEIDRFRAQPGAQVCELAKFAFDVDGPSQPLLAALFHIVFLYGQLRYDCTDLFIEVNPRHRRFYESMLGFRRVGDLRTNESVSAPSQLMHLKVADIKAMIEAHRAADTQAGSRSLYPFFLSKAEAEQVNGRLRRLMTQGVRDWAAAVVSHKAVYPQAALTN